MTPPTGCPVSARPSSSPSIDTLPPKAALAFLLSSRTSPRVTTRNARSPARSDSVLTIYPESPAAPPRPARPWPCGLDDEEADAGGGEMTADPPRPLHSDIAGKVQLERDVDKAATRDIHSLTTIDVMAAISSPSLDLHERAGRLRYMITAGRRLPKRNCSGGKSCSLLIPDDFGAVAWA